MEALRTSIDVDGLNLYHGCVRGTRYKWLDLKALLEGLLKPHNRINRIYYFTTLSERNKHARSEQEAYIKALEATTPEFKACYGHFIEDVPEEKGSDVNLAIRLLDDAWLDAYDCAVIVSNDTDQLGLIKLMQERFPQKTVLVFMPTSLPARKANRELENQAHFATSIEQEQIIKAQLPDPIPGTNIRKPEGWYPPRVGTPPGLVTPQGW